MPCTNPRSRRLARLHHPRQRALLARVDAGANAIDRAIGGLWQQLLAVIRTTHGYPTDFMRALAILNQLPAIVSGTLAQRLRVVYHQAHRGAGLSVVEVLPQSLRESRYENRTDADAVLGVGRFVLAGGHPFDDQHGSEAVLLEDETATEPTVADLLLGPPSEDVVSRALAPFVRLADWIPIGNESRRLPQDLAGVIAGGMAQGQSQRDIALAIRPYLDGSRMRARRAARTFGMVVAHGAQTTAWEQSGLVMGYRVNATLDQNTRPAHRARDGNTYWKRPGLGQIGMESMPHPPREADGSLAWNCILPGQKVQGRFIGGSKAFYSGQAVEVFTASGLSVRVTANHPVLTQEGFIPANQACKGDYLARHINRINHLAYYEQHAPALVQEVFGALKSFAGIVSRFPGAGEFHGDAAFFEDKIEVVLAQRELSANDDAHFLKRLFQGQFICGGGSKALIARLGASDLHRFGIDLAAAGSMGRGYLFLPDEVVGSSPLYSFGFGLAAHLNASRYEHSGKAEWNTGCALETATRDANFFSKLIQGFPAIVAPDKIIKVRKFDFTGHVYDLQGYGGWIVANNIFISNCRCFVTPVLVPP